jgi:hypothetical protein
MRVPTIRKRLEKEHEKQTKREFLSCALYARDVIIPNSVFLFPYVIPIRTVFNERFFIPFLCRQDSDIPPT